MRSSTCAGQHCERCLEAPIDPRLGSRLDLIEREYRSGTAPWVIGFSGGKDSSAVLKLVFRVLERSVERQRPVYVVYCDTGVEIPPIATFVRRTLEGVEEEAKKGRLPLTVRIARPAPQNTFFVKVIGRGYPPPTNKFRWCTDRLRIDPVRQILRKVSPNSAVVLLGTRKGESSERDRTLRKHRARRPHYYKQSGNSAVKVFAPIEDFTVLDVWSTLYALPSPLCLDTTALAQLYRDAGSECPIVRDSKGTPCGAGRFGCWTCTVVRKDRAVSNMVEEGRADLRPLLEFRNWIAAVRDEPAYRCRWRRNGRRGLGPLTLAARKEILRRLRVASRDAQVPLIEASEVRMIHQMWSWDRHSDTYRE